MWNVLFAALCRWCQWGASTRSLALDDSWTPIHLLLFLLEDRTLHSFVAPSFFVWHSCLHRYTHSQGKNFGASSIRPSGFKNSSANSVQIPGGYPHFVPSWEQYEDHLDHNANDAIANDFCFCQACPDKPFVFTCGMRSGLHLTLWDKLYQPIRHNWYYTISAARNREKKQVVISSFYAFKNFKTCTQKYFDHLCSGAYWSLFYETINYLTITFSIQKLGWNL